MKIQEPGFVFSKEQASSYDQRWAKLAPTRDALYLLIRATLSELPEETRILCVGVGTGSELIDFAQAFPRWQFTVLDPSTPMLDVCRQRARECGIESRCTFHDGYLDSLPASEPFDAATCLLVSHFILRQDDRRGLFKGIASRLRPQGYLISSDLAYNMSAPNYPSLLAVWLRMMRSTGVPEESIEKIPATFGRDVEVLPINEVESIIASGGFEPPVLFFQSLLVHAWFSRRI